MTDNDEASCEPNQVSPSIPNRLRLTSVWSCMDSTVCYDAPELFVEPASSEVPLVHP